MVFNLVGEDRLASMDAVVWEQAFFLAQRYGWNPAGTEYAPGFMYAADIDLDDWDGRYLAPDGQVVTAADAEALASALAKAQRDIPGDAPPYTFSVGPLGHHEQLPPGDRLTIDFLEFFASDAEARQTLREIERIASEGEFRIT